MKSVQGAIEFLTVNLKYASSEQIEKLRSLVLTKDEIRDDGKFNILSEVQAQMDMVRKLRKRIESSEDLAVREIRDLVTSSTQLFAMLTKMNNEIVNQDRIRKIEEAVITTIKSLTPEAQDCFFTELEKRLP